MAVLRLVPAAGTPIQIDKDQAIVGREPACEVFVNDGSVSRRHARLERRGAAWFVVDQGSANGTYLDSQRVSDALLRPGQELRFGAVPYRVELLGDVPSAEGTMMAGPGMGGYPAAPPPPPRPGMPPPPAPPRAAPPRPMAPPPPPRAGGPPPPPPPAPPASTDTAPFRSGAGRRPRPPRPATGAAEAPPAKQGHGGLYWVGMGCGGCLVAVLLLVGAVAGFFYFSAKGAREVVNGQLAHLRAAQVDAAYDTLSSAYKKQVSREAFGLFVAQHPALSQNADATFTSYSSQGSGTTLGGFLTSAKGERELATFGLVQEGGQWKVAAMEVAADHPESKQAQGPSGLRIEPLDTLKRAAGNTIEVQLSTNVAGFEVRPQDGQYGIDLAVDVETLGPDGLRIDALSRDDVQRFLRTTSMEKGAVAPITVPLTVDRSLPEGTYTVRVRVRDRVGGGEVSQEARIALP